MHKEMLKEIGKDFDKLKAKDKVEYEAAEEHLANQHKILHKLANR